MAAVRTILAHVPEHPDLPPPSAVEAEVRGLCISEFPESER